MLWDPCTVHHLHAHSSGLDAPVVTDPGIASYKAKCLPWLENLHKANARDTSLI
jgi:hypothetical protein